MRRSAPPPEPSSTRDQQLARAREIDQLSTVLVDVGVRFVKRNPIKVGLYVVGLLICLLFNGISVSQEQNINFEKQLSSIDYSASQNAGMEADIAYDRYYRSKGWFFSCNQQCQINKEAYEQALNRYKHEQAQISGQLSAAKSSLGLYSEFGVSETRNMFWDRFGMGKSFATRQTKYDALFMGLGAMGRDESLVNYLMRIIIRALFNFTLGVCMAVVTFMWSLVGLIRSYQPSMLTFVTFFGFASIAAISFALTWLIGKCPSVFSLRHLMSVFQGCMLPLRAQFTLERSLWHRVCALREILISTVDDM